MQESAEVSRNKNLAKKRAESSEKPLVSLLVLVKNNSNQTDERNSSEK
jgi:hypothetical protein